MNWYKITQQITTITHRYFAAGKTNNPLAVAYVRLDSDKPYATVVRRNGSERYAREDITLQKILEEVRLGILTEVTQEEAFRRLLTPPVKSEFAI